MMLEKHLQTPTYVRRNVNRALSLFRKRGNALVAEGVHFREENDVMVTAEGCTCVEETSIQTEALFRTIGMDSVLFSYANETLKNMSNGDSFQLAAKPSHVFCFADSDDKKYYALTQNALYALQTTTDEDDQTTCAAVAVSGQTGGGCCAVHYERVVIASGSKLMFSAPLSAEEWTCAIDKGGSLELPNESGDVIEIISFEDHLFLMRERGITKLYASGDMREFYAREIPFACGKIKKGSIVRGESAIYFFTESGLYSFNGASCLRIPHCGSELITRDCDISAAFAHGNYYAAVKIGTERCIFCYDIAAERGHFIRFPAERVVGGTQLLFTQGKKICQLTEQGFGAKEGELNLGKTAFGLSGTDKILDGIVIDGSGKFRVEVRVGNGLARYVRGTAGEYLRFAYPVRGRFFSIRLKSYSEDASIRSMTFDLREAQA